jgi:hypothetical protein
MARQSQPDKKEATGEMQSPQGEEGRGGEGGEGGGGWRGGAADVGKIETASNTHVPFTICPRKGIGNGISI